ncbi:ABC transporter ATP-binding protein [Aeropyrum camini]|uniref:ABC transporter ATP-binding protein n=1 Tax=Aeropyrum camini SY1 = JCM 12091 TaxID=1198449 RepID=U3TDX8_9CREN|nr:ABC transporter ATP-binding protein [Aeropyrum camini]BAN90616.1 ABC transporter ATP-binding protein [Aeropyrum camini SY1 = JCM 12091]
MAEAMIEASNLVKRFVSGRIRRRVVEALRGVSFRVYKGEIYSFLGPNGAGKTTTVRILATLLDPDGGEARVAGFDVVKERWEVRRRIGVMLSVERGFYWKLTGRENLYYFGRLYGIPSRELKSRIEEVLDIVGLKDLGGADKPFEEMSLGMKARLGLARVLLKDPEVLILDEPTLGLDPASARTIRGVIKRLASEGRTIFITTHNMVEAELVSDRAAIIVGGRIAMEGTPDELKKRVFNSVNLEFKVRGDGQAAKKFFSKVRSEYANRLVGGVTFSEGVLTFRISVSREEPAEPIIDYVTRLAYQYKFKVLEIKALEPSLEDVFVAVSGSVDAQQGRVRGRIAR